MPIATDGWGIETQREWRLFLEETAFKVRSFLISNLNQTVIEAFPKIQCNFN